MKKIGKAKKLLLLIIAFLCGINICKAGSLKWYEAWDKQIKSFKCTYDVKDVSGSCGRMAIIKQNKLCLHYNFYHFLY